MQKNLSLESDLPSEVLEALPNSRNNSRSEATAPAPKANTPAKAVKSSQSQTPRARGQSFGASFATLNGNAHDSDRCMNMAIAVDAGFRDAARCDEYERAVAESPRRSATWALKGWIEITIEQVQSDPPDNATAKNRKVTPMDRQLFHRHPRAFRP